MRVEDFLDKGRTFIVAVLCGGLASCSQVCLRERILDTHSSSLVSLKAGLTEDIVENLSIHEFTARVEIVSRGCHPNSVLLTATASNGGLETATVKTPGQVAVFYVGASGTLSAISPRDCLLKLTLDEE